MDRRTSALAALTLFAVATVLATVLDGRLPASEESVAGWVVQALGYLAGITGGMLLLAMAGDPARTKGADRRSGFAVVAAMVVIVLADVVALGGDGGANIGLGFVRLMALVVVFSVCVLQVRAVALQRRDDRPTARP
ncbi:hypothetical protein [Candidatus Blastococcus massiliensis]|uniref:hypothetical protein n=1 Tax=Candidatus Blastococcus massiliensis TaxID=1470358 RepID=UPI0004B2B3A2|nr:hypothetical protein [Candidatus Blastococcus massiliensis]